MFELLTFAETGTYFELKDGLGCSRSMQFDIDLISDDVKPVCHNLRRTSKVKTDFIDAEVKVMKELGVVTDTLGDW